MGKFRLSYKPRTKTARVLDLLKSQGTVTNWQLNKICFRYSAIIHNLRREGHQIVTNRINNDGLYEFTYKSQEKT